MFMTEKTIGKSIFTRFQGSMANQGSPNNSAQKTIARWPEFC